MRKSIYKPIRKQLLKTLKSKRANLKFSDNSGDLLRILNNFYRNKLHFQTTKKPRRITHQKDRVVNFLPLMTREIDLDLERKSFVRDRQDSDGYFQARKEGGLGGVG